MARAELWIKDDGVIHPNYGGNKVRKLEFLLADAARRDARRLLVLGAAGSHQVLATTLFGRERGFETLAVVCPQVFSEHAVRTLRTALALGVEAMVAPSIASMPVVAARHARRGDYLIAPGGAGTLGTLGYLHAVRELLEQIREGVVVEPDIIVVPVASGGTAGGLLAGVLREGLRSKVLGILVADPARRLSRALILGQAWSAMRRDLGAAGPIRAREPPFDRRPLARGRLHLAYGDGNRRHAQRGSSRYRTRGDLYRQGVRRRARAAGRGRLFRAR